MSDFPEDGPADGLGGQPGQQGPGEQAPTPPGDIIVPTDFQHIGQPTGNPQAHHNRVYIPADWVSGGGPGGSPKVSGGVEVDTRTGAIAPRGLNRANQRYELTQTEIQTRRKATAASEYASTSICLGERDGYHLRSVSRNCYEVSKNLVTCDCPDWMKQEQSGYGIVRCKHIWMVITALNDPGLPDGLDWGTGKFAEVTGIDIRTVERLCQEGFVTAFKVNSDWHIPAVEAPTGVAEYKAKMWPFT